MRLVLSPPQRRQHIVFATEVTHSLLIGFGAAGGEARWVTNTLREELHVAGHIVSAVESGHIYQWVFNGRVFKERQSQTTVIAPCFQGQPGVLRNEFLRDVIVPEYLPQVLTLVGQP